jgi:CHAD domain-containing protein
VSSATQAIAKLLRQRERALRRHTKRHLRSLELAKLGKDVGSLIHALLHDVQSAELVEHALLGELARRHLEVERRRGQSEHDQARGLHRARLALKDYRYELEVLASLLPARSEALRVTATELQAQLGQAHDQHVLSRRVRRLARTAPAKLGPPLKSLAEALDQQSAAAQLSGASALRAANLQFPS